MDENDPKWIDVDKRLRAVIAEMDDDFLERVVNATWCDDTTDAHWYDATMQMMYCIVSSCGVPVDEFFREHVVEPHNNYLLPEYEMRKKSGSYDKPTAWDGLNKNFNRAKHNISPKWKHHE
jgi:hypothetical protein